MYLTNLKLNYFIGILVGACVILAKNFKINTAQKEQFFCFGMNENKPQILFYHNSTAET